MLFYVTVLLVVLCLGSSNAWFLNNRATATATREADPECLAHGAAGRCEFYSCFEDRLPCGSRWYIAKYGSYYCQRFESYYNDFNEEAKAWINATSKCLTENLLVQYNREEVQCHDLSHYAWDTWSSCYQSTGFCSVFWENRRAFWDVYQFRDLFSPGAGKIWREMTSIIVQCMAERGSQEFSERGGIQGFINGVRDLGDRIRNTVAKK